MKGALIILIVTVFTGFILYLLDRKNRKQIEISQPQDSSADTDTSEVHDSPESDAKEQGECCGLHLVCEKELDAIADNRILYYDDEELNRFIGRNPDNYTPEETEEFRDIMLTLLPQDIPGWARSLDRRNIQPPREIRDELLILLQEITS